MIDYEKIEKIVLLFWDEKENFHLEKTQQKIGKLFQNVHHIDSLESFKEATSQYLDPNQEFLCFVHLAHSKSNKGYDDFINSKILKHFPRLRFYLITSALRNQVYDKESETLDVYTYDRFQEKIFSTFLPQTKREIVNTTTKETKTTNSIIQETHPNCKYAIITALELDEMEQILPTLNETGRDYNNKRHRIRFGHLASNHKKTIVYASQSATGMVDAAILATELIIRFKPEFLIMAGVLGGKPNKAAIGDVVIPSKVFTTDKGKITEKGFQPEIESENIDSAYISDIKSQKDEIIEFIRKKDPRKIRVNIHFDSLASVRQVIDLAGHFKEKIETIDRKAIALEMESYGIVRACKLVNNGTTEPLIIKSVMDNTSQKDDTDKPWAAWTSARVVQYILEHDII